VLFIEHLMLLALLLVLALVLAAVAAVEC